jgi:hypothetical protein
MSEENWCPARGGTYTAYEPEYEKEDDKWEVIPTYQDPLGVPVPAYCGGITKELGLFGRAQAWALAWQFAAHAEATGRQVRIRVAQYEVKYDIKARRLGFVLNAGE